MGVDPAAVLLDLDETLCRPEPSPAVVLERAFEDVGVDPFFEAGEYDAIAERYLDDFETKATRRAHVFADLAERHGHERDLGFAVAEAYAARRKDGDIAWIDGARGALDALHGTYPLALVTNGEPTMQDPKLDALGVEPAEALYVGNSLDSDVAGAHNAGLAVAWLDRTGEPVPSPEPDYRLDSMHDLPVLIDGADPV